MLIDLTELELFIEAHQSVVVSIIHEHIQDLVHQGVIAPVNNIKLLEYSAPKTLREVTLAFGIENKVRQKVREIMSSASNGQLSGINSNQKSLPESLDHMPCSATFNIANPEDVQARVNELKDQSREIRARLAPLLKKLWDPQRELKVVDNFAGFTELRARFPNFTEVVDLYQANAIALSKVNEPFEAQPILLCGEPGLGKTLFAAELSKTLGLPYYEIALSTVTASFALSGGSVQWEGGSCGFIARSLADSQVGNPLFLIDELDKSSASKYDPMNSFYSLLERHTACRFKDEAVEIKLNASKIVWIATANDSHNVPEAILSRMRVFDIKRPDESGMRAVINSVYTSLRKNKPYGRLLSPNLDNLVIEVLLDQPPRAVRQSLEEGMLKAIMADREHIVVDDLIAGKRKGKSNVGFI